MPERVEPRFPTGRRTWLDPAWLDAARSWIIAVLGGSARSIIGVADQRHVTPWSTAIRFETDGGPIWFKASGPGPAHEGPLLEVLRQLGTGHILLPLAVHAEWPWLLFEERGPTLRATRPDGAGDHDLRAWERILRTYALVQRSVEHPAARRALLGAGTPDLRPGNLVDQLRRLVEDEAVWHRIPASDAEAAGVARRRLGSALADDEVEAMCAALDAIGVRPSIEHGDLHGGNILVGPAGATFFDWGDAAVAHPFATLTTTFNSIAHRTGRKLDDPVFVRLRDIYTEAWTDVASRARQAEAATLARRLGCIGRSLSWERALRDLETDQMDGHGDVVAGWLVEFAETLDSDPTGWVS